MPDEKKFFCPETGADLTGRHLRKYAELMWPSKSVDNQDPRCEEARKRKAIVLEEAKRQELAQRSGK